MKPSTTKKGLRHNSKLTGNSCFGALLTEKLVFEMISF